MSSNRVILGHLLSSRARLRFPGQPQPATSTPVRHHKCSERHTGTSSTVSLQGVTPQRIKMSRPKNQTISTNSLKRQGIKTRKSWRSERVQVDKMDIEAKNQRRT